MSYGSFPLAPGPTGQSNRHFRSLTLLLAGVSALILIAYSLNPTSFNPSARYALEEIIPQPDLEAFPSQIPYQAVPWEYDQSSGAMQWLPGPQAPAVPGYAAPNPVLNTWSQYPYGPLPAGPAPGGPMPGLAGPMTPYGPAAPVYPGATGPMAMPAGGLTDFSQVPAVTQITIHKDDGESKEEGEKKGEDGEEEEEGEGGGQKIEINIPQPPTMVEFPPVKLDPEGAPFGSTPNTAEAFNSYTQSTGLGPMLMPAINMSFSSKPLAIIPPPNPTTVDLFTGTGPNDEPPFHIVGTAAGMYNMKLQPGELGGEGAGAKQLRLQSLMAKQLRAEQLRAEQLRAEQLRAKRLRARKGRHSS